MLQPDLFFDLSIFGHRDLFSGAEYVWDGLKKLKTYMDSRTYHSLPDCAKKYEPLLKTLVYYDNAFLDGPGLTIEFGDATKGGLKVWENGELLHGASVIMAGAVLAGEKILLGKGVKIEPGAYVGSPAIIGDMTEIRQGAYLRGYCLIGRKCVVGHVTEVKHTIFMDEAKAGHFAYLGDSILGRDVNLGAGTKLANLRFTPGNVQIRTPEGTIDSGLRKFGAILADFVQTGCNSVTNPGTILGPKSMVLPNTTVPSGLHGKNSIIR
ncbi:MAG: hypothetical protein V1706_03800 [Pseudomonadota bacterium]